MMVKYLRIIDRMKSRLIEPSSAEQALRGFRTAKRQRKRTSFMNRSYGAFMPWTSIL
jgi:hypothetical protein